MMKLKRLTLVTLLTLGVSGCLNLSGSFCSAAKPIRPALGETARLSDQLVAQLDDHNGTGVRLCRWRP